MPWLTRRWHCLPLLALLACNGDKSPPPPPGDDDDDDDVSPGYCTDREDGGSCDGSTAVVCADGEVESSEACPEECVDGVCLTCSGPPTISVPGTSGSPTLHLVRDGSGADSRAWRYRAVEVTGTATAVVTGAVEVVDEAGEPIVGPITDATVYLRAPEDGLGTVSFGPPGGCPGDPLVLETRAAPMPRLVGTVVAGVPGFDDSGDLFFSGKPWSFDVPVARFPELDGEDYEAWVVPHRDDWTDPSLAGGDAIGPIAGTVGTPIDLGTAPEAAPWSSWDVVADLDRDGQLGPGDLMRGEGTPSVLVAGPLTAPGPHPIDQQDVSGTTRFSTQRIYWPTDLDTLDPMPLVVISHGNGHRYDQYDDLGQHLASHGYVAMAHENNTVPGPVAASRTTISNTNGFLEALPTFEGGLLDGEVDPHAIVWVGHSRGGEGIVLAWRDLVAGQQTATNFVASDVVLLSSIAPTLFEGPEQADPGDTPYHLIAGSADGDVTGGVDLGLVQYFRIFQGATNQRFVTYVQGADHNDFNSSGIEDSAFQDGRPLIGTPAAQAVNRATHLALLGAHFSGRSELLELVTRSPLVAQPYGSQIRIASIYEPPEGESMVIEDFQTEAEPLVSSSGGDVTFSVANPFIGPLRDGNGTLSSSANDPMNGMSWVDGNDSRPDNGLVFEWATGDDLDLEFSLVPGDRDLTDWDALSLRACQSTRDPANSTTDLTFAVELEDGAGVVSLVPIAPFAAIPYPFQRGGLGQGRGWVNEFQTVRLPLTAFERAAPGFDRSDVRSVRLRFGEDHGTAQGRLGFDDLMFVRELP